MECPKCHHENKPSAKFCASCGTKLQRLCSKCGAEVDPDDRFCSDCGVPLTEGTPTSELSQAGRQRDTEEDQTAPDAERRQLTVMFCDLVGSTALSEQLDPEVLREVVRDYQEVCAKVIALFEGHISKYIGDGLLAYFGYPQAHEDDAQRAARAGLGILSGMEGLNARLQEEKGISLGVRIGIHTGLVIAGEMGSGKTREELAIVGKTPNIAARIEGVAPTNTVTMSQDTYLLIEGYFSCQSLGPHTLKGISEPMEVFQVLRESSARSRLDVSAIKGLTPLVGREGEVRSLHERWDQMLEGKGQAVLLSGEAGIGKSRLVQMLKEHVAEDPQAWLIECQCSPYYQNSAFYPIINFLEKMVLQFDQDDSIEEKIGKLEGFLVQYGLGLEETVPLFASLLSLPLPQRYSLLTLPPERQKGKTMEALLTLLRKRSAQQPVLFVVEDLHWIDPSTLEFISLLVDQESGNRILTLLTYRPDFRPPWVMHGHLNLLTLNRFVRKQIEDLVVRITGKRIPDEVLDQIVTKTDGVPLFVEELTKMVLESGLLREEDDVYELTGPLPPLAIPATLQDSLMARLDRLATVKEVAQLAATIGREFSYELLQAISLIEEKTLQRELSRLVEVELIYQRGLPPQAMYIFKHALIQEAAYQSLLKTRL